MQLNNLQFSTPERSEQQGDIHSISQCIRKPFPMQKEPISELVWKTTFSENSCVIAH